MKKLIKLSTCLICLGTVISGLSVTAMEDNNEYIERNQATNGKIEEIYNREIASGKSEIYAGMYATLAASCSPEPEEVKRRMAEVYEKEIKSEKSDIYARKYVESLVKFNLHEELSRKIATTFEREMKLKRISDEVSSSSESDDGSDGESKAKHGLGNEFYEEMQEDELQSGSVLEVDPSLKMDADMSDDNVREKIKENSEGNAEITSKMISLYDRQRRKGESVLYSVEYVRQFFKMMKDPNKCMYAKRIATSFEGYALQGFSQEEARKKALQDHHITEERQKRLNGIELKSFEISIKPRRVLKVDLNKEIPADVTNQVIIESFEGNKELKSKMISLYNRQRKKGKSIIYSVEYVRQFYEMEESHDRSKYAEKLASSFEKYVSDGLPQEEARKKSLEDNKRRKRRKRSKVKKILLESRPVLKTNEDLKLNVDISDESVIKSFEGSEKAKRKMVSLYSRQRKKGKSIIYSSEYARQYYKMRGNNKNKNAARLAERFEQCVLDGLSQEEAREKLLKENRDIWKRQRFLEYIDVNASKTLEKMNETDRKKLSLYIKKRKIEGKSDIYAREYIRQYFKMGNDPNRNRNAEKFAEIFEKYVLKGLSRIEARKKALEVYPKMKETDTNALSDSESELDLEAELRKIEEESGQEFDSEPPKKMQKIGARLEFGLKEDSNSDSMMESDDESDTDEDTDEDTDTDADADVDTESESDTSPVTEDNNRHAEWNQAARENDNIFEKNQDSKIEEIYKQELVLGKSEIYARMYATLAVSCSQETEETKRKMAEVYEKEIESEKSDIYARKYVESFVQFNLPEELSRRIAMNFEKEMQSKEFDKEVLSDSESDYESFDEEPEISEKELLKQNGEQQESDNRICDEMQENELLSQRLLAVDLRSPDISDEKVIEKIGESFKENAKFKNRMVSLYKRQRNKEESIIYSLEYVRQSCKMVKKQTRCIYAKRLAGSFEEYMLKGFSQEEARKKALEENHMLDERGDHLNETKLIPELILGNEAYGAEVNLSDEDAIKNLREIFKEDEKLENRMIALYNKQREKGKSALYSEEYVMQFYKRMGKSNRCMYAKRLANAFEEYVLEGYSREDARRKAAEDNYAISEVRPGLNKMRVKTIGTSSTESRQILKVDWDLEISADASDESIRESLKERFKDDEKLKAKMVALYDKQRKKGKSILYSTEYVRQFYERIGNQNQTKYAREIASSFERYVLQGFSQAEARQKALGNRRMKHSKETGLEPIFKTVLSLNTSINVVDEGIIENFEGHEELRSEMIALYNKQRKKGKSMFYSTEYARQYFIMRGRNRKKNAKKLARKFEKYIMKGYSQRRARKKLLAEQRFLEYMDENVSESISKMNEIDGKKLSLYIKEKIKGKSDIYAGEYVRQYFKMRNDPDKDSNAKRFANLFEKYVSEGLLETEARKKILEEYPMLKEMNVDISSDSGHELDFEAELRKIEEKSRKVIQEQGLDSELLKKIESQLEFGLKVVSDSDSSTESDAESDAD